MTVYTLRRELLDSSGIDRCLQTIAGDIAERNGGTADVALVGIRTGGLVLAERLQKLLGALSSRPPRSGGRVGEGGSQGALYSNERPPLGAIDIALYRDDVFEGLPRPQVGSTELPFSLPGKIIVLIDDVLYTGRTVRAALQALVDYGRPRAVQLAVLVDRGNRELPIHADYVGLTVATTRNEQVVVLIGDKRGATGIGAEEERDRVVLRERIEP